VSRARGTRPADDDVEVELIAHAAVNVMVTATEAGERVAWARRIHDCVLRRDGPFVAVYPVVHQPIRAGEVDEWFARAERGTLFIDEIGELGADAQARLSTLIGAQSHPINGAPVAHGNGRVRVIAGSGRSLRADVAAGTFDDTLFYRLNVVHVDQAQHNEPGEHAMKAREVMSQPPQTCGPNTDLASVAKIMWDHDCGFVPVVDASGVVAGVITDRDICMATSTRSLLPGQIAAAQAMTAPIHACMSDDSLGDVLATMRQFQIRRVPVIDAHGRLQGVISLNDIVLAATDRRELSASDVVATMAAICARRRVETAVA
jgi:CBS domain-containing protein